MVVENVKKTMNDKALNLFEFLIYASKICYSQTISVSHITAHNCGSLNVIQISHC